MADRSLRTGGLAPVPLLITLLIAAVVGGVLAVVLSFVDGEEEEQGPAPLPAEAVACREQWGDLARLWDEKGAGEFRSDLSARWSALAASADLQRSTADGEECAAQIAQMRTTAAAIEALSAQLRPFDLIWQHAQVTDDATTWLTTARPKPARQVRQALARLERLAPVAAADMDAAWQSAVLSDLSDPEAMAALTDSMRFLETDSAPFRQGKAALTKVQRLISRR